MKLNGGITTAFMQTQERISQKIRVLNQGPLQKKTSIFFFDHLSIHIVCVSLFFQVFCEEQRKVPQEKLNYILSIIRSK